MTTSRAVAGRAVAVLAVMGSAALGACEPEPPSQTIRVGVASVTSDSPTPAPRWAAGYAAVTSDSLRNLFLRDSLGVYGRALTFDTIDGVGDQQPLRIDSAGVSRFGPDVRIEPQIGAYLLTDSVLAGGRVVARMINQSADSAYAPLRMLPSDTVYWWVEQRGTRWVSVFVRSLPPAAGLFVDSLRRTSHGPGFAWKQSIARWVWGYTGSGPTLRFAFGPWTGCTGTVCCERGDNDGDSF